MSHRFPPKDSARIKCEESASLLLPLLQKTDTVIDAGARFGAFSMAAAPLCKQVLAFEPNPYSFKALEKYIKKFDNIQAYQIGLYNDGRPMELHLTHNCFTESSTLFKTKVYGRNQLNFIRSVNIRVRKLDKYFNRKNIPYVIHCDVEGAELQLIEGATEILKNTRLIAFESHNLAKGGNTRIKTVRVLNNIGFDKLLETIYNEGGNNVAWTLMGKKI
jgi:FkbM family methyltransferase